MPCKVLENGYYLKNAGFWYCIEKTFIKIDLDFC